MMRWLVAIPACLLALSPPAFAQQAEFRVIVNAANSTTRLTSGQLTDFFMNRGVHWPHGLEVMAVDQSARSPVREVFTRRVMGKTVDSVVNHWKQRMMVEREAPLPVKSSDADVIAFVAKNRGGVGYVGPSGALPAGVKVLEIGE